MRQLPLDIQLRVDARFDNFVVGKNAALCLALQECARNPAQQFLYWHGVVGSGCSHLAHALAGRVAEQNWRSVYLPLSWPNLEPDHLDGLEYCDIVILDDIDRVVHQREWCLALFKLFNAIRDSGHGLAIAAQVPPVELVCAVADVQTRLCSMTIFGVQELQDEEKIVFLMQRADERGMQLNHEGASFLLTRSSRSMPELLQLLQRLETATLEYRRKLTIPFIKQILSI